MKKTYQIDKQRAVQQFRKQAGTSNEQISSHSRWPDVVALVQCGLMHLALRSAEASNRKAGEVAGRGRRSAGARLKTCEMLDRLFPALGVHSNQTVHEEGERCATIHCWVFRIGWR